MRIDTRKVRESSKLNVITNLFLILLQKINDILVSKGER
jgi:hypothetical protein